MQMVMEESRSLQMVTKEKRSLLPLADLVELLIATLAHPFSG